MANSAQAKIVAKPYDHWRIAVHVYGSVFDGMGGDFRRIDQTASHTNLKRLSTGVLVGAFPGADVQLISHEGANLTSITVTDPSMAGQEIERSAPTNLEVEARVRRLLSNVFQRMDWFIENQP
ncbi:MAG: hypothetical protein NTZ05_08735 [Chloroflexi bacterium]|nr:hypothetical protein [Chloroflexota bacterium]